MAAVDSKEEADASVTTVLEGDSGRLITQLLEAKGGI